MKKINYIDSIRNPIITEKATILSEQNKTVFKVHEGANKKTIKKNIEKLFKVKNIQKNDIIIKEEFNFQQSAKDLLITSQLRAALIINKAIKSTNYNIDTYKKKIYIFLYFLVYVIQ